MTHFLLTAFWDSVEAVSVFAGDDYIRARYYPEDDDYLLEREPLVTHYDVVTAVSPAAVPAASARVARPHR